MFPLRTAARCVLYYNTILARGPAGRVPVASPRAAGAPGGIEPAFAPVKRIAVLSLAREAFALLLHLHRPRGYRSPMEPSIKGEMLALPSEYPINHGLEICLSTWTDPCTNVWPFDRQGSVPATPNTHMTKTAFFPYCQKSPNARHQLHSCLWPVSGTDLANAM